MKKIIVLLSCFMISIFSLSLFSGCKKEVLRTELNGIVYESNSWGVNTCIEREDEDDYNFYLKGEIRISITNTNSTPFNFQAGSFNFTIGEDYPFNFYSLKNTSNNFVTNNNQEIVTIPANTQTVLEIEYRYLDESIRADNLEILAEEIDASSSRFKNTVKESKYSLEIKYLTTKVIESNIHVAYYSAQNLIDWYLD